MDFKAIMDKFYTGFKTADGEKVYLGDKLVGKFYFTMLVQYDFKTQKYVLTTTGKDKSPYRSYKIEDLTEMRGLRVISNSIFYSNVSIGDLVRITVENIKGSIVSLGDHVEIVQVNEWDVLAQSLSDTSIKVNLKFGEFLAAWRFQE